MSCLVAGAAPPAAMIEGMSRMGFDLSARIIGLGERAFYRQIEQDMVSAYAATAGVMSRNLLEPDAHEGIDAFFGKRAPRWQDEN